VEFKVNGQKTDYAMKLGEGGEAFFVFETSGIVPEDMQTSPLVSPAASPRSEPSAPTSEPDYLDIADSDGPKTHGRPLRTQSDLGNGVPIVFNPAYSYDTAGSSSPSELARPASGDWSGATLNMGRTAARSDEMLTAPNRRYTTSGDANASGRRYTTAGDTSSPVRSRSPPPLDQAAAVERALALSRKLSISNIQTHVTDRGDLMLDMHGYKLDQEDTLEAEKLARKILAEELDGDYDIGSLIGADRHGNLWIYSSEEAKLSADREHGFLDTAASDGGYYSDDAKSGYSSSEDKRDRAASTPPSTPPSSPPPGHDSSADSKSYAKTLRLTSEQLKSLNLKPGANEISFSVNRATCTANMYLWRYDVPIVISDIDGTITKSDALGHILTMVGRDWTHLGVAKLYTDIAANGYNILYLTSRSVGSADSTRNYLNGVVQDNYRLPKGPVIMSPDRTFHALRREVYLRKPEVFKMACLRDILNLFGSKHNPFYAGFGNRLTDALSYRSVNIPSTRIFTINSNAEVVLDLLCLTKYKSSYVNMRDLVDHFFPPVHKVVEEEYTDFNYWREGLMDPDEFTDSDEEQEGDDAGYMGDSYIEDEEEEYEDDEEEDDVDDVDGDDDDEDDEEEDGEYAEESDLTDGMIHEPDEPPSSEHVRHGEMKNDLDGTRLQQAKEFVEHELGAIADRVLRPEDDG
jgi:phosphatidate phosphatase LPIN